jgi:hypothetical protein
MAQPTLYERLTRFYQDEQDSVAGRSTVRTQKLDDELDNIETSIAEIIYNLSLLQRDDELLGNAIVHPDSFTTASLALIASTWTPRGLWVTATAYVVGDVVENASISYVCATAHTSGTFATDKAAGKWVILGNATGTLDADMVNFTPYGPISATDVQAALQELADEKALVAGSVSQKFSVADGTALTDAVSLGQVQKEAYQFAVATGTGNAMTAAFTPAFNATTNPITDGVELRVRAPSNNTSGAPTIDVGQGAVTITKLGGAALATNDIFTGHELLLRYRASPSRFELLNPGAPPTAYNAASLTSYFTPSRRGWGEILESGWVPWSVNNAWGGPFNTRRDGQWGDMATSFVGAISYEALALDAARTWLAQGFRVGSDITVQAIWVCVGKAGSGANPTGNLELRIMADDGTGKPSGSSAITNGTATAIPGRAIGGGGHATYSEGDCKWQRFVFPTPPSLTAGTQYHVSLKSSAAVDANNYFLWAGTLASGPAAYRTTYPHGAATQANGTPTWSTVNARRCFMVEPATSEMWLQTGGTFDAKLVGMENTTYKSLSRALCKRLSEFFDPNGGMILLRGGGWTKDRTIFDAIWGLDHNRLVVRVNATTGYVQVDLYEDDGTKHTITGTTDVSGAAVKDIAVAYRAIGDGSDYLRLYVNGAQEAEGTGKTITFSPDFAARGHAWLMGGFPIAPTWTQKLNMGSLPSSDSPVWTFGGTATEADAFQIQDGRLHQNIYGYGSTATGYYTRGSLSLSNTNGWTVATRVQVPMSPNVAEANYANVEVLDGTKYCGVIIGSTAAFAYDGALSPLSYHAFSEPGVPRTLMLCGKGSDQFVFMDGALLADNSGRFVTSSGSNAITFGDQSSTAGANAEVWWDEFAFYNTAWIMPEFSSGTLAEFGYWNADRSVLLSPLWNSGTPQSIQATLGLHRSYLEGPERVQESFYPYTATFSNATSGYGPVPGCSLFVVGRKIRANTQAQSYGNTGDTMFHRLNIDGFVPQRALVTGAGYYGTTGGTGLTFGQATGSDIHGMTLAREMVAVPGVYQVHYSFVGQGGAGRLDNANMRVGTR